MGAVPCSPVNIKLSVILSDPERSEGESKDLRLLFRLNLNGPGQTTLLGCPILFAHYAKRVGNNTPHVLFPKAPTAQKAPGDLLRPY